jgi:hypothetical protein
MVIKVQQVNDGDKIQAATFKLVFACESTTLIEHVDFIDNGKYLR